MKKNIVFFYLLIILKAPLFPAFDSSSHGTTAASILELNISPRCVAMGEACTSNIYDASTIDINPASLVKIKKDSFYVSYNKLFEDISMGDISYAKKLGRNVGSFGVGIKYLNWGEIPKTDDYANDIGVITPNEMVLEMGFATYLTGLTKDEEDRLVFGGIGKFIRTQIDSSATTLSADVGILFPYLFEKRLLMSLVFQNIIGTIKMDKTNYNITKIIKVGSSVFLGKNVTVNSDIIMPADSFLYFALGIEGKIDINKRTKLFLRAGGNTRNISDLNGLRSVGFGFGIKHWNYLFDYSFSPFGDLGNINRISLSLNY
jgi:hypothetical protein